MHLQATRWQKVFTMANIFFTPLVASLLLFYAVLQSDPSPPAVLLVLYPLLPISLIYSYGRVATELTISNDREMQFTSLFQKKTIRITDITSIDVRRWNHGFIYIKAPGARVFIYRAMPGALEAMKNIVTQHPFIEIKE
jgi:DMSO reductase anchor subunit